MRDVFVTGVGLVTPLGASLPATWDALAAGRYILNHSKAMPQTSDDLALAGLPTVSELAVRAAREALTEARWVSKDLEPHRTGLVVGTSKGPVERWIAPPPPGTRTSDNPSGPIIGLYEVAHDVAAATELPAGPRLTLSAACASGLHALIRAALMIRYREVDRALVVAAEASVHPLFVGSFTRLGVLPPEGHGCRPFDLDRAGFVMSDAAAAVCLEASPQPSNGLVRLDRFAMGGDATHLTGVDPDGKTLRRLLAHVLDGRPVDLVHGHGTGTPLNDPVELAAIEHALGDATEEQPTLYSHKGAIGHTLGAAGLVSVVLNVAMARRGVALPNIQTRRPMPAGRVSISRELTLSSVRRSIAIAAGFGGPTAVVSLTNGHL